MRDKNYSDAAECAAAQAVLAEDITELLAGNGYSIKPTVQQVRAALPAFLTALAETSSDMALQILRLKLR